MSGQVRPFGATRSGHAIEAVTIRSATGAQADILTWGAVIRDLLVPAKSGLQRVVLGYDRIEDYEAHSPYFGAVPGRFANRVGQGRFTLDGETYDLSRNEKGITTLHGGKEGFGVIPWRLADITDRSVRLELTSHDGDQGFPGTLQVSCLYSFVGAATLRYELRATTDKATVVNLTNHSYFNLDGSADILDHELMIAADAITPTDADLIPTGELQNVAGSAYDFRTARTIRNAFGQTYDINYALSAQPGADGLRLAARSHSAKSGVTLEVHTDQPGVQFYDAAKLDSPVAGLGGVRYGRHAGFCLETQVFPDAPNKPQFPSAVLRPGKTYGNTTEFRFS